MNTNRNACKYLVDHSRGSDDHESQSEVYEARFVAVARREREAGGIELPNSGIRTS